MIAEGHTLVNDAIAANPAVVLLRASSETL